MLCLHVAAGLNNGGVVDFWRDMYWATVIANGERFPLSGPPINNLLELGPWWFYLCALPLWLTHRIAAASVFIQLLAGAKYFLAWRLGMRAVDAKFGLAFAVSMAVAGWSTASFWFPSHPAVIETTCLLLAFAVWRCANGLTASNALLFGLAATACLHAHPATMSYIAIGGIVLLHRNRSWRGIGLLGLSALVVVASLSPGWFDNSPKFPNIPLSLAGYASSEFGVNVVGRLPGLLKGLLVGGAWTGFLLMTKWSLATATFAWWAYCAGLAIAGAGIVLLPAPRRPMRRWFAIGVLVLVAQTVFLAAVRPFTPIWMVPSCLPPLAFVFAIGWYGWLDAGSRAPWFAGMLAFVVFTALSIAPFGYFLRDIRSARVTNSNPLFNISDIGERYSNVPVSFVTVRDVDELARTLCEPATLHLRLGAIMETTGSSALRNACGRWPDLRFSAAGEPGPHIGGISSDAATAIGIAPDRSVAHMALYSNVRAVAPVQGTRIAGLRRMEVARRPPDESKPSPNVFEFDAGPGDVVAVTNRYPPFAGLTIGSATANGMPAKLMHSDGKAFLYRCEACGADAAVHWRIPLDGVAANLDVTVLLARARADAGR